jgi:hypothetical protein
MGNKNNFKGGVSIMLQIYGDHYMLEAFKSSTSEFITLYDERFSIIYLYRESKEKGGVFGVEVGIHQS